MIKSIKDLKDMILLDKKAQKEVKGGAAPPDGKDCPPGYYQCDAPYGPCFRIGHICDV